jgi:hypothetical protein
VERKMTAQTSGHGGQATPEHYVNQLVDLSKPGANYRHVKGDLDKGTAVFMAKYDGKAVAKSDREQTLNKIAATYLGGMFGIGYDDPTIPGSQIKQAIGKMPDGSEVMSRLYGAIERGDKAGIVGILNQAWQAQANKLETVVAQLREQSEEIRMAVYGNLANLLGDVDGYKGSVVSVAENLPGAVSGLQQRLAVAESVSKSGGEGHATH